jgi:ABC-type transport system involved in multi-copper enzyme maturation permease subunit
MGLLLILLFPLIEADFRVGSYGMRVIHRLPATVTTVLFLAAVVLVRSAAEHTIVAEREKNTLDMLLLTLISPAGIVIAKLLAAVSFYFLYIIAAMPVLALIFPLSGVSLPTFVGMFVLLLAVAFSSASVGLFVSAAFRRKENVRVVSVIGILVILGVPFRIMEPMLDMAKFFSIFEPEAVKRGEIVAGYLSAMVFPISTVRGCFSGITALNDVLLALSYQAFITLVFLAMAFRVILRPQRIEIRAPKDSKPNFAIRWFKGAMENVKYDNPIFEKELAFGVLVHPVRYGLIFLFLCLIQFSLCWGESQGMRTWLSSLIIMTALAMLAPAQAVAGALSSEYEYGDFAMLRLTGLSSRDVIYGKFFAYALGILVIVFGLFLASMPVVSTPAITAPDFVLTFACLAGTALMSASVGVMSAAMSKSRFSAGIRAFLTNVAVWVALWMLVGFLTSIFLANGIVYELVFVVVLFIFWLGIRSCLNVGIEHFSIWRFCDKLLWYQPEELYSNDKYTNENDR